MIRCLYKAGFYDEASEQVLAALQMTNGKALFIYYHAAVLLMRGKTKEALLQLESGLTKTPKMLKKFVELNPGILQNQQVVDILAKFKRNKSI